MLAGFKEVLSSHLVNLTFLVNTELSECQQHVGSLIQAVLVEHKLGEIFEQAAEIDQGMMRAACDDQRFKQLFNFAVFAKIALKDAKKVLKDLIDLSSSDQIFFQDLVTKATALIKDLYSFSEEGCSENKGGLSYCGRLVGSVTVAQSLVRTLSTGQTRQGLVNNALQGLKRHGFDCHTSLLKCNEALIRGKPLSK